MKIPCSEERGSWLSFGGGSGSGYRPDRKLQEEISLCCERLGEQKPKNHIFGGFCIEAAASPMSILSWNCQGAGSIETVRHLRGLRRKYFPDFIFLMETKQKTDYLVGLKKQLGYDCIVTVDPDGLSGGLAVMWKDSYQVTVLSSDKRIIDLKVSCGSSTYYMSCVYGDPVTARRQEVWNRLVSIGLACDEAWILVGDFNEILSNEGKSGGAVRSDFTFWNFRNMVQNCKIKELRYSGNCLSWAVKRENGWVKCRLDRSFGNSDWFALFPRSNLEYLELWASDHRPIRVCFALERDSPTKSRFQFDKRMLSREGFEDLVRLSLEGKYGESVKTMDHIR